MMTKHAGMKVMRTALLGLCTLAVGAVPMMAQDQQASPNGDRFAQMEQRQLDRMTQRLNLSPDQVSQIKTIQDNQRSQMMALRQDSSMSRDDRRAKMMSMRQDTETKIRAVLNDDQKTKYDEMLAHRRERMGHRGMGGGMGDAPPPPSSN